MSLHIFMAADCWISSLQGSPGGKAGEWSGVEWSGGESMEGGREDGREGRKKPGWSDECRSGEMAGRDRGTDGWRSEEGMRGWVEGRQNENTRGLEGGRWPRVEVRHRGWRERWRNNEQAGPLKRMRPNSSWNGIYITGPNWVQYFRGRAPKGANNSGGLKWCFSFSPADEGDV